LKDCDGLLHRSSVGIVLSEALDSGSRRLAEVVSAQSAGVALAVGPEGGWSEDELEWFQQKGWMAASLGGTILRAETAAIVATALAMEALR
jgi:16S rRNA (uracil1498-N3)-methyltransferase